MGVEPKFRICVVRLEGFEPPTSCFVGRRSNPLNYRRAGSVLLNDRVERGDHVVRLEGLEPPTSWAGTRRSIL